MINDDRSVIDKLFDLQKTGVKLGLENIRKFLDHLGNPQESLYSFHIAGSNGKGSTASFIASILQEAGFRTGLYTSPHLIRYSERIKINGIEIDEAFIEEFYNTHEAYILEKQVTFFEVTTALAFSWFRANNVNYAVVETGLGGRLDATNVLDSNVVVITSISLEHTRILGDSLKKIAFEKASIIKEGTIVCTGSLHAEADEVIREKCEALNNRLFPIDDYIIENGNSLTLYTEELILDSISTPLRGKIQKVNSAVAALAVTKALHITEPAVFRRGIANVTRNTGIHGRYETLNRFPALIVDTGHNAEGIVHFLEAFSEEKEKYEKRILLFSALGDKAIDLMLKELAPFFNEIYIAEINHHRAATLAEIEKFAQQAGVKVTPLKNWKKFINSYAATYANHCLVGLGSMFFVSEIKQHWQETKSK